MILSSILLFYSIGSLFVLLRQFDKENPNDTKSLNYFVIGMHTLSTLLIMSLAVAMISITQSPSDSSFADYGTKVDTSWIVFTAFNFLVQVFYCYLAWSWGHAKPHED